MDPREQAVLGAHVANFGIGGDAFGEREHAELLAAVNEFDSRLGRRNG
jgi:hypothetical protein